MNVILYSTGCPRCQVLKKKLERKNIVYQEINDIELMKELGIVEVPVLKINGELLEFNKANDWINLVK